MSKFGQTMLENANIESYYVPHAIESSYKPTYFFDEINMTPREFLKLPKDAFVVGMNAANKGVYPCRKAFGENLLAFSMFAREKKDAYLYLHTDASGSLGGIKMRDLILSVGIPEDKVIFIDPYLLRTGLSIETMAGIYTAMDVLLATSYGEGFGVPTIEAQACGTPVFVSDFAASAELVGDGWKIGGQPLWDAPKKTFFHVEGASLQWQF
jgi:glycosyltransferase involved in cell wall biosynthesis